jgi:hypothetical protein
MSGQSWNNKTRGIIEYVSPINTINSTWGLTEQVRVLLHPGAEIEVQALPAPADAGNLCYLTNTGEIELMLKVLSSCFRVGRRRRGVHYCWTRILPISRLIVQRKPMRGCTKQQTGQYTTKRRLESVSFSSEYLDLGTRLMDR